MENKKRKEKSLKFDDKLTVKGSFNDVLQAISFAAKKKTKNSLSVLQKS